MYIFELENGPQGPESFTSFSLIALNDLTTVIGKMKPSSCSLEKLPPFGTFNSIGPLLLSIINSSLKQGCVSFNIKHAEVNPLLKKCNLDPCAIGNVHHIL